MSEQEVINYVSKFIVQGHASDEQFNELALYLYAYHYKHNLPYQKYCRLKGITPRTVKTWRQIPPVPVDAFKDFSLSCINPDKAERIFMTSGTTQGIRGKHYHPNLYLYDLSMKYNFRERFMGKNEKIHMGILFPTEEEMPNSSLAHYLAFALQEFGTEHSSYFIDDNGLKIEYLIEKLEHFEKSGEPCALLGASYSFVHILDELEKMGKVFNLPKESRILDTGGFKNQSREMNLDNFYNRLSSCFGVDRKNCINMYGMTELSTQFYDNGNMVIPSIKSGPHWIKTRVINPITGQDVPKGEKGLLVHCDLANFNSVTTILTEDIGVEVENGFLLLGRSEGAEAKGCSIAVEEFIQAKKGVSL
ncbi:Acyl-protein synthetase, LuxE [Desulfonispora thiosulfatigenes DSM 11270]|uniref:Acyl-protein synthetase, LuxE n=1 Tax=Desulfonispora thiosulfatigenes DSM 11270 TaxID=656914 RepID=A0A1W1UJ61_DESTI|nr:long-chain fatty acid--CoA ligase [Desulfonispora thiosulfatigenes]SMB80831.1 Acyl-protein synthetase, LuxE [Desulfonispora thiosulfatigenes DSM 11270]